MCSDALFQLGAGGGAEACGASQSRCHRAEWAESKHGTSNNVTQRLKLLTEAMRSGLANNRGNVSITKQAILYHGCSVASVHFRAQTVSQRCCYETRTNRGQKLQFLAQLRLRKGGLRPN